MRGVARFGFALISVLVLSSGLSAKPATRQQELSVEAPEQVAIGQGAGATAFNASATHVKKEPIVAWSCSSAAAGVTCKPGPDKGAPGRGGGYVKTIEVTFTAAAPETFEVEVIITQGDSTARDTVKFKRVKGPKLPGS
jgi:hypothetical protein